MSLQETRSRRTGIVMVSIILALTTFYLMNEYVIKPYLRGEEPETIILWEGEITGKEIDLSQDVTKFKLLINTTTWKEVPTQIEYEKYNTGTYVYYVQKGDFIFLLDENSLDILN